jgi:RimJ/RimL family protein N-acetyltransferase
MKDIYKGELVRLSAMNAEEISKAFARWGRDSEFRRLLDSGVSQLHSAKGAQTWLEKELAEQSVNQHWFSIRKLDDDQLLGDIDLYVYNWSARDAFVGLGIGEREFWGRGYGTDMMKLCQQYVFTELGMERLSLGLFEYNPRALRSYEKSGFRLEGRTRKDARRDGKRYDSLWMGILRDEWLEMQNGGAQ